MVNKMAECVCLQCKNEKGWDDKTCGKHFLFCGVGAYPSKNKQECKWLQKMSKPVITRFENKFAKYFKKLMDTPIFIIDNRIGASCTDLRLWFAYNNMLHPLHCTSCNKPITKKEAKQFDNQCKSCWYEMCQERTLNEEIER